MSPFHHIFFTGILFERSWICFQVAQLLLRELNLFLKKEFAFLQLLQFFFVLDMRGNNIPVVEEAHPNQKSGEGE